jgi:hypothetical protein
VTTVRVWYKHKHSTGLKKTILYLNIVVPCSNIYQTMQNDKVHLLAKVGWRTNNIRILVFSRLEFFIFFLRTVVGRPCFIRVIIPISVLKTMWAQWWRHISSKMQSCFSPIACYDFATHLSVCVSNLSWKIRFPISLEWLKFCQYGILFP